MNQVRLNVAVGTAVIMLSLAACSGAAGAKSASPPGGSAGTGTAATTTAPVAAAASSSPAGGGLISVCAAVPLATVVSLTHRGYTEAKEVKAKVSGFEDLGCVYKHGATNDADALQLVISVIRGGDPRGVFALMDEQLSDMTPISGLGDSAQGDDVELDVAWGKDVVVVQDDIFPGTMPGLTRATYTALAQKVHQSL